MVYLDAQYINQHITQHSRCHGDLTNKVFNFPPSQHVQHYFLDCFCLSLNTCLLNFNFIIKNSFDISGRDVDITSASCHLIHRRGHSCGVSCNTQKRSVLCCVIHRKHQCCVVSSNAKKILVFVMCHVMHRKCQCCVVSCNAQKTSVLCCVI